MTAPRLTARGGPDLEAQLGATLDEIAARLSRALPSRAVRSVLLHGGYGRGEGGAIRHGAAEHPHNNFDILIVARGLARPAALKTKADAALASMHLEGGLAVDVGVIHEWQLRMAPSLLMWHDLNRGHRVLVGDAGVLGDTARFSVERIPSWDARNLLVNRGTLLVINELMLASPSLSASERRTIVKHAMKAIVGYGDALLFFVGEYHGSYREKQRRMRARVDMPEGFRARYDAAMEFRFSPDYASFDDTDLVAWHRALRADLESIHLDCERRRLDAPRLTWATYADTAFPRLPGERGWGVRALIRAARALARPSRRVELSSPPARWGYRATARNARLPLIFPAVAYDDAPASLRAIAAATLGVDDDSTATLRRAYVRAWGVTSDPNCPPSIRLLMETPNPTLATARR